MSKAKLTVNVWSSRFTVDIDGKLRSWLFHKLFAVKVTDNSRKTPVDITERVGLPPRPGRVVERAHDPETIPTKPKAGGRVVMILPPGVKRMKRSQEHGVRRMP